MFGRTGQVATEVLRRRRGVQIEALSRAEADLSDPAACAGRIETTDADVILNAAAWTNVDGAETEEAAASIVNGAAPAAMAFTAAARKLPFIHISSDYVFDGSEDAPRNEAAPTAPINKYGWTKLAGETGVQAADGPHVILRTSWVFSAHGRNFVKTMLRLGQTRKHISVVDDQIGGPTPAAAIADACLTIARAFAGGKGVTGVYHFSGAPEVSWRGVAEAVFAEARMVVRADPILTADYPTPTKRPLNSRLDCARIQRDYGIRRPDWRAHLTEVIREADEQA